MFKRVLSSVLCLASLPATASAQERIWTLDVTENEAFLVFGVPETDDVGVSFWCTLGTKKVKVFVPDAGNALKPNEFAEFKLNVDDKPFTISGKTSANEMEGTTSIEGEVPVDDAMFTAMRDAVRFSVVTGTHTVTYPLEDADVKAFTEICSAT